jgi:hypothetical protein
MMTAGVLCSTWNQLGRQEATFLAGNGLPVPSCCSCLLTAVEL